VDSHGDGSQESAERLERKEVAARKEGTDGPRARDALCGPFQKPDPGQVPSRRKSEAEQCSRWSVVW